VADVAAARKGAGELVRRAGFGPAALAEIDVAVSELATNLVVHHTVDGEIVVSQISDHLGKGVEIVARDRGPGIADVQLAVRDHYSMRGAMGCGLGAVRRLMDEFDVYSHVPHPDGHGRTVSGNARGTIVTARKWLVPHITGRFVCSANSRPCPGETANGDGFLVTEERDGLFVALVDGLGHGEQAAAARRTAMESVRENSRTDLARLLRNVHQVLRKMRGAAMTVVRISLSQRTLTHAGIGNVQARVYPRCDSFLIPLQGILGVEDGPLPRINTVSWPENGLLIVFSDGISGRWDLDDAPGVQDQHVTTLSHLLMQEHSSPRDDATVVLAREVSP